MHQGKSKFRFTLFVLFICIANGVAGAAPLTRANTWEFSIEPRYMEPMELIFDSGASVDVDDSIGLGVDVGYYFSSNFALRVGLGWDSADYDATRVIENGGTRNFDSKLEATSLAATAEYIFSQGRISPFINASAGWTYVDTNIPSGPTQGGCWWDPWYGYICATSQPSVTKTEFSYGAAAGLRFDLSENFFMRASVGKSYIDYDKNVGDSGRTIASIGVGVYYD